jgi:hypothetical protein
LDVPSGSSRFVSEWAVTHPSRDDYGIKWYKAQANGVICESHRVDLKYIVHVSAQRDVKYKIKFLRKGHTNSTRVTHGGTIGGEFVSHGHPIKKHYLKLR